MTARAAGERVAASGVASPGVASTRVASTGVAWLLLVWLLVGAAFGVAPTAVRALGAEGGLQGQLGALAAQAGLEVSGLERLGAAAARPEPAAGDPAHRLRALLHGYNYVLAHGAAGQITGVRILGARRAGPPRVHQVVVPVTRRGSHHLIEATLAGPTGAWETRRLILDTGATTIVLPASAIARLGFRASDLTEGRVDTAGGQVAAKSARLASVTVGQAVAHDVDVTFIADDLLGDSALLGMSFLDRFQLSLDDAANRIILITK